LAKALLGILERGREHGKAARVLLPEDAGEPCYVFLALKQPQECSYEQYRTARRNLLEAYCMVAKVRYHKIQHLVGVASEPFGSNGRSEDLLYLDARQWSPELDRKARELSEQLNILRSPNPYRVRESEYPLTDIKEMNKGRSRNARCSCGSGKKIKKCCGRP
jgi:hypothetical protein